MANKFVAVVHRWFVNSRGFVVVPLEATTADEAEKERAVIYMSYQQDFSNAAVHVLEIAPDEHVVLPRRLSWTERLTGWTGATP